ncbi:MAG TPA: NUDIX domain-containing protein [Amaricoccus sp.]|uniref:NUDIX domain-containing protein n=1 Tax=Amaricoccus sp. TaxID=1872485 RepID=UPI002BA83211|nr:NUDIX domain-containing protein [Amaricoccus sp.]HMQ92969.1 NUDIX domain-containing protein [Amaricoccus sp.]HMR52417.1 NUDIX domain-containing protein [Amaricoccus sp.]HMR60883.1 NUDIX domain-containing protein [Amaricoccus sp.]HMT99338.1 NUDIX domain-containing protein [Amaricoccus sp.]
MTEIFLPGPLGGAGAVAAMIGGAEPQVSAVPAILDGHRLQVDCDGLRLVPVPAPGAELEGRLIAAGGEAAARLRFGLASMGGRAGALPVRLDGEVRRAEVRVADAAEAPGAAWSASRWSPALDIALAEALAEVLGQFGRCDAGAMPRLLPGIAMRAAARTAGRLEPGAVALRRGFARGDVAQVALRYPYAEFFGIEEHLLRHRRFDGSMSEPVGRAVFTSGDAVTVLPFDPRRDAVLLIEQFRAGPHARRDSHPWCLEAVAGRRDGLELPEETARREAREEAGLELGRLERIAAYYPAPGVAAEFITAFVGEADLGAAGGVHGLDEEHEDIRGFVAPLDAALATVASGEANNAPLLVSLLWLALNRHRLVAEWSPAGNA